MGKYGDVAVKAACYVNEGHTPLIAWNKASCEIFKPGSSSQKKGCPKNAFLGLYGGAGTNAMYAQKALAYLKSNPNKNVTTYELWANVMSGVQKVHNQQMDVVLSLYHEGLI
ncbi:MAG: hypothetical protein PHY15_09185 [Eubacteriales bacterium]|nr:hypothetical protein [Eubacteriales bacterium]MDD4475181.1 hypothetical protein [Eubacteriales bacterium]